MAEVTNPSSCCLGHFAPVSSGHPRDRFGVCGSFFMNTGNFSADLNRKDQDQYFCRPCSSRKIYSGWKATFDQTFDQTFDGVESLKPFDVARCHAEEMVVLWCFVWIVPWLAMLRKWKTLTPRIFVFKCFRIQQLLSGYRYYFTWFGLNYGRCCSKHGMNSGSLIVWHVFRCFIAVHVCLCLQYLYIFSC